MNNTNRKRIISLNKSNRNLVRLSVYRSNRNISASLLDDVKGVTIITATSLKSKTSKPMDRAAEVGLAIAALAKDKKISEVVFDRNNLQYHGQVKALAEAARSAGLKF